MEWVDLISSCNKGISELGLVSPGWWKCLGSSVVSCKSMNSWFDQDQSEFAVLIGSEFLNMLSDIDGFLDKMIEILWKIWGNSAYLQDSEDLRSCNTFDLRYTILISEDNTNLWWRWSSLGQLDDLLCQFTCRDLNPTWWWFPVRKTSAGNTLSKRMHSTHCF